MSKQQQSLHNKRSKVHNETGMKQFQQRGFAFVFDEELFHPFLPKTRRWKLAIVEMGSPRGQLNPRVLSTVDPTDHVQPEPSGIRSPSVSVNQSSFVRHIQDFEQQTCTHECFFMQYPTINRSVSQVNRRPEIHRLKERTDLTQQALEIMNRDFANDECPSEVGRET